GRGDREAGKDQFGMGAVEGADAGEDENRGDERAERERRSQEQEADRALARAQDGAHVHPPAEEDERDQPIHVRSARSTSAATSFRKTSSRLASWATSRWARISASVPWATIRPRSITATSSQSRSTTSSTCVVKKRVTPFRVRRWRRSVTTRADTGSIPFSGSSRNSTFGLWMSAAASAS